MSMKYIRDAYGIPVKRGMEVYYPATGESGNITSCKSGRVTFSTVLRQHTVHPFDLDYLISDDQWLEGARVVREYNSRLDDWNERLNEKMNNV